MLSSGLLYGQPSMTLKSIPRSPFATGSGGAARGVHRGVQFCVEMKKPVRAAPSPTTGDRILIGWNTLTPGELSEFGKVGETGEAAKSRWNVMSPDSRRAWRAERAKTVCRKN